MEIHHDRSFLLVSARRPDIQAQAVLVGGTPSDGRSSPETGGWERNWRELCCIEQPGPGVEWLRWEKTIVRDGRVREWNTFPDTDGSLFKALYFSIGCFNEGRTHSSCSIGIHLLSIHSPPSFTWF